MNTLVELNQRRYKGTDTHSLIVQEGEAVITLIRSDKPMLVDEFHHGWYENQGYKLVGLVNCNYFGAGIDGGVYVDSGYMMNPAETAKKWITAIYEDGELYLEEEDDFGKLQIMYPTMSWATQVGDPLVKDGVRYRGDGKFDHTDSRHPRTMMIQKHDGTIILMVTNGREDDDLGFTADEAAEVALAMDAKTAVLFDGGGSSTMVADGVMVNNNENRKVYSVVAIYAKEYTLKITRKIKMGLSIGHDPDTYAPELGRYDKGIDGFEEFDFNKPVGLFAKAGLERCGFEVVLDQPVDSTGISLTEIIDHFNDEDVEFGISIHGNANNNPDMTGHWAFCWKGSEKGMELATYMEDWANVLLPNRNVGITECSVGSWCNFGILRKTRMPWCLYEFAFFTNDGERELMQKEYFQKLCAEVIVRAACNYAHCFYVAPAEGDVDIDKEINVQEILEAFYEAGLTDVIQESDQTVTWGQLARVLAFIDTAE